MIKKGNLSRPGIILVLGVGPNAFFLECKERFEKMSDEELINAFNSEVGNEGVDEHERKLFSSTPPGISGPRL